MSTLTTKFSKYEIKLVIIMDKEIERALFSSLARLIAFIHKQGGKASFTEARKAIGSQIYTASFKGAQLNLLQSKGDFLILTEKGMKIAECIAKCIDIDI